MTPSDASFPANRVAASSGDPLHESVTARREGDELSGRREPDVGRMLEWLRSAATDADGSVRSWVNPEHPGYPYPEAAGLLLTLLAAVEPRPSPVREAIARRLQQDISPRGAVGRGGLEYAFDTAMALHGLHAHAQAGGRAQLEALDQLHGFIADRVAARSALGAAARPPEPRWSTSWGCHLIKLNLAIETYDGATGRGRADELIEQLLASLLPLARGGRFVIHAGSELTYLHASCYALEGLTRLHRRGHPDVAAPLVAGARWLAAIQDGDGSLPAWHDGARGSGPRPADIVAQSVRLWAIVDPERYAASIARGLDYLASLQTPAGGLRYHPGSADVNTWSTIFAAQATLWARRGASLETLA